MLTFREFYEICEAKRPDTPPHAVAGTYKRDNEGTISYTLQSYDGPMGKPTKKEVEKLIVKRIGGKEVKKRLKKLAKSVRKIEEQSPTMEPNLYSQQVARRQAAQKTAQIRHVHQELGAEARAQQAAKQAKEANCKYLILGHFSSRYEDTLQHLQEAKTIHDAVIAAEDGLHISLGSWNDYF